MKKRTVYYDVLRILAIFCVIYNHTNERGYFLYALPCTTFLKIFYMAVAEFIAIGVPIFFMISGALLLGREESITYLYKKRVLKIFIVLVLFSLFQFLYRLSIGDGEASLKFLADNTINQNIVPSYWFLYTYLAYLISLPLLRKLAMSMTNNDYKYLIIGYLVIEGLLAVILYLIGYQSYSLFFDRPFFNRIIIYPLVGYYLDKKISNERFNRLGVIKLLSASAVTIGIFVAMTIYRDLPYKEFTTYDKGLYTCGLTLILDITVFYIIKYWFDIKKSKIIKSGRMQNIINYIGGAVFGIYLVEGNVRYYTEPINTILQSKIGVFPAAIVWVLIIFIIGLIISIVMKHIPGLRKLL